MPSKIRKKLNIKDRTNSFGYAFKGIFYALKSEHNIWIHCFFGITAIAFGIWLDINLTEWIFVLIAIGFVFTAEIFNTAIEILVDIVSPEHNPKAGLVKDIAAGAVLIAAITAALIGLFVFGPKIIDLCY